MDSRVDAASIIRPAAPRPFLDQVSAASGQARRRTGRYGGVALIALPLFLLLVAAAGVAGASLLRRDRRLRAQLEALRASGRIDQASSLRTRQAFSDDLELEVLRVARTGRPASLILLSVGDDGVTDADFPRDVLGHVLESAVRAIDLRYQTGGNEFALILPETRAQGGLVAAARIETKLAAAGVGPITAGVAELGPGMDRRTLFRNAYSALLAAGRSDRPNLLEYSPEIDRSSERAAIKASLPAG